jgi:hypothetical protein
LGQPLAVLLAVSLLPAVQLALQQLAVQMRLLLAV